MLYFSSVIRALWPKFGNLPPEIVLQAHNVVLVRRILGIGVLPNFGHNARITDEKYSLYDGPQTMLTLSLRGALSPTIIKPHVVCSALLLAQQILNFYLQSWKMSN